MHGRVGRLHDLGGAPRPEATCSSEDAGSGVDSTSGPAEREDLTANGVGTVTVTCSATDTRSYRFGYGLGGFLWPVRDAPADNRGHAGRAYPLVWRPTGAAGRPVGALSAVTSIRYRPVSCATFAGGGATVDADAPGHSRLRYLRWTHTYVFVWKTPRRPGCYALSVALDSGQALEARFRLR